MNTDPKLTPRQRAFADEYIRTGNAFRSSIKAGYSEKYAGQNVDKLLKNKKIDQYIAEHLAVISEERLNVGRIDIDAGIFKRALRQFNGNYKTLQKNLEEIITDNFLDHKEIDTGYKVPVDSSSRYEVFKRAGFKCQCCGDRPTKDNNVVLTVDHIVPRSLGGRNNLDNLQCLCFK